MPVQAFGPDIPAVDLGAPVTRDLQAMPVRVRSAAEEDAVAPVRGKPMSSMSQRMAERST